MPEEKDYTETNERLRMLLETIAEEEGQASKFVQRKSKMTASCFAQALVLGSLNEPDNTLTEFAQLCADLNVIISPSGFNQRLNEAGVVFMQSLLGKSMQLCQANKETTALLQQFSAVQILDSSYIALPKTMHEAYPGLGGGQAAGLKVFLNYDYLQGELSGLELTPGRQADQKSRLHLQCATAGSLHLFDLGFFKQEIFAQLDDCGAYFISRYQTQTALYWPVANQRLDLGQQLGKMKTDEVNLAVLLGQKARVPVRLVCRRLPKEVAAERRRKAKRKAKKDGRRKQPSAATLQLLDWAIFITNVPVTWLSVEQILTVYTLRWQIELLFKLWKSRAHLDQIGPYRAERVFCQFYARLIALVLFHWLVAPTHIRYKELSLPKAFALLQHHIDRLIQAVGNQWRGLSKIWARIEADFQRLGMKDKRKNSPSTYQLLVEAGL